MDPFSGGERFRMDYTLALFVATLLGCGGDGAEVASNGKLAIESLAGRERRGYKGCELRYVIHPTKAAASSEH